MSGQLRTRLAWIGALPLILSAAACTSNVSKPVPIQVITIQSPDVGQPITEYPNIVFQPHERVVVTAGGCVQTGGFGGETWKLYANPDYTYAAADGTPNDEYNGPVLYQGLIWIPGATMGLVPIENVVNRRLIVSEPTIPIAMDLRLGYTDDDYSDNGYYSHDDGEQDQCKGVGDAWVTIRIYNRKTPPIPQAPMNLIWSSVDVNGFPFNPMYHAQAYQPGALDLGRACTPVTEFASQSTYADGCWSQHYSNDNGAVDCPDGAYPAHSNFGIATMQGKIFWSDWSSGSALIDDNDYNMKLEPHASPDPSSPTLLNGLIVGQDKLQLEFDSDETIDFFRTAWWNDFHRRVEAGGQAPFIVYGQYAIVIGLMGIDFENLRSIKTESHPVYAMAIDMGTMDANKPFEQSWEIFVRNWGNEGGCSDSDWPLYTPGGKLTFLLPWLPGYSNVSENTTLTHFASDNTRFPPGAGVSGPFMSVQPRSGLMVSFTLPDPSNHAEMDGTLVLDWS